MTAIHLTKEGCRRRVADFEQTTEWKFLGSRPALIDFYASWCGPCKMLSPVIDELAQEYEGKVDIYKVNVDQEEDLSALFGIRTIPTLIFINAEGEPERVMGGRPKAELREKLDQMLK